MSQLVKGTILFLFSLPFLVNGQEQNPDQLKIDSLNNCIAHPKNDTTKVLDYFQLANIYSSQWNRDSTIGVATQAYNFAINILEKEQNSIVKNSLINSLSNITYLLLDVYTSTKDIEKVEFYFNESVKFNNLLGKSEKNAICFSIIASYYSTSGKPDLAIDFFKKAEQGHKKHNDYEGLVITLKRFGHFYRKNGDLEKAYNKLYNSVQLSELLKDTSGVIPIYNELGVVCQDQNNYSLALDYFYKALNAAENKGDPKGIGQTLGNIGLFYLRQENFEKAIEFNEKALILHEENNIDFGIAANSNNLGNAYSAIGEQLKALKNYKKSLSVYEKWNRKIDIAKTKTNIAKIYTDTDSIPLAIRHFEEALNIGREIQNTKIIAEALIAYGTLDKKRSLYNKALIKGNESLKLMQEIKDMKGIRDAEELLGQVYKATNNWKNAFVHYENFIYHKDSVVNIEAEREAFSKDAKYQIELAEEKNKYELLEKEKALIIKESRINDLKKEKERKNITIIALSIISALILLYILVWIKKYKQKKLFEKREITKQMELYMTEIDLLQSVIKTKSESRSAHSVQVVNKNINELLSYPLSKRELEILQELTKGKGNQEIGDTLFISINTVRSHLAKIYEKLEVKNRLQAVRKVSQINDSNDFTISSN